MQAPGRLVKVNDTHIHVYRVTNNSKHLIQNEGTIVFLSGSGTECPTYDFKPLWYLLAGKYKMVLIERPGYGWSGRGVKTGKYIWSIYSGSSFSFWIRSFILVPEIS